MRISSKDRGIPRIFHPRDFQEVLLFLPVSFHSPASKVKSYKTVNQC